ncbi:MAG: serine/threonine protein kinase [Myxococcales bacterium]|nr:serine/threonine protein kinase [Myxococcales bacterium]MCB9521070.1 serine/threonine protein kinase [Myxococcales bacterium]
MAVAELPSGTQLGPTADGRYRYEVRRTLGAGGFGITYLARDQRLDGDVVVKELACAGVSYRDTQSGSMLPAHGQDVTHQKLVSRFVREARLLNRLRSPHIVRVTDVWEERGTAYYAMDKIDFVRHLGEPFADGVTTSSWRDVEVHALQLLDALAAVHAAGLVHGDVKPANVLVDRRDGVVLIDFGTARAGDEFQQTVTSTSFTRGYAPPELMLPSRVREAGPWSDLYSWGMVVWGLVLTHPGDGGRPTDALARLHGLDPYVDAAGQLAAAGAPAAWAGAVADCLRLEPTERPQSVRALRERLGLTGVVDADSDEVSEVATLLAYDAASAGASSPARRPSAAAPVAVASGAAPLIPPPPSPAAGGAGAAPTVQAHGESPVSGTAFVSGPPIAAESQERPSAESTAPRTGAKTLRAAGVVLLLAAAGVIGLAVTTRLLRDDAADADASAPLDASDPVAADDGDGTAAPSPPAPSGQVDGAAAGAKPPSAAPPACPPCGREQLCFAGECRELGDAIAATHTAWVDAFNARNSKAYFFAYGAVLDCYYSQPSVSLETLRELRGGHFTAETVAQLADVELSVREDVSGDVVVTERSRVVSAAGASKPQERVFAYRRDATGRWVIVIEAGSASHACAPQLFPSDDSADPAP